MGGWRIERGVLGTASAGPEVALSWTQSCDSRDVTLRAHSQEKEKHAGHKGACCGPGPQGTVGRGA